jgi:hypothetical protein
MIRRFLGDLLDPCAPYYRTLWGLITGLLLVLLVAMVVIAVQI